MDHKDQKIKTGRTRLFAKFRKFLLLVLLVSVLSGSVLTTQEKRAEAFFPCFCIGLFCYLPDTLAAAVFWFMMYEIWEPIIRDDIEEHLNKEENWIVETFFKDFFIRGLMEMTEYLSAAGMYQMEVLGSLFDAKNNLEAQRTFWRLQAEAHKDYHPSEDFCWIGTSSKALAASEDRGNFARQSMSRRSLSRHLGNLNNSAALGVVGDKDSRWRQFVKTYCDPKDNNWSEALTGLDLACDHDGSGPGTVRGAVEAYRTNRDIDYTRLIDSPRSLRVDFTDDTLITTPSADEEDVLAMGANLYGNKVLDRSMREASLGGNQAAQNLYIALRSVAAKRSVAENSFNALVAFKAAGTGNAGDDDPASQVRQYMAAIVKDLMPEDTEDAEIYKLIGENPSYYAQLEILSKKIYENPDFYANLYDTPANVERKSVAMKAIEMMVDRALYESELRQEMLMSVLLSGELRQRFRKANTALQRTEQ